MLLGRWTNLHLVTLDKKAHARTLGYWYLIQAGASAHTAFRKRSSLLLWLRERNLELTEDMPEHGQLSLQLIKGSYQGAYHSDYNAFYSLKGERTRDVENGEWTMAILTKADDGMVTVNVLIPNCHDRIKYNYAESLEHYG